MAVPSEPLLPPDPPARSRLKLWLLVGGAGVVALGGLLAGLLLPGGEPDEATSTRPERAASPGAPRSSASPATRRSREVEAEEAAARARFAEAETFEREHPQDLERIAARYREVYARHPSSASGRRAEEKFRVADDALQKALDREFDSVRRQARTLADAGRHTEAIDSLRAYQQTQSRDGLRRRADEEIAAVENASRSAWNQAAAEARARAAKGEYGAAAAAIETLQKGAIAEVAERCRVALKDLKAAAAEAAEGADVMKAEAAHKSVRETVMPRLVAVLRARRYDEALREIDAALQVPAYAPVKEALADERAAIAEAASFWEAFLKSLRGKLNLEVSLALSDRKPVAGKLLQIHPDRLTVDGGLAHAEVPVEKIPADLIVGWTVGKTLPAEEGTTYVKAALFFFCDGRDELAKLYLATAHELKAPADAPERIFREGFLRAATPPPKAEPPKRKKGK